MLLLRLKMFKKHFRNNSKCLEQINPTRGDQKTARAPWTYRLHSRRRNYLYLAIGILFQCTPSWTLSFRSSTSTHSPIQSILLMVILPYRIVGIFKSVLMELHLAKFTNMKMNLKICFYLQTAPGLYRIEKRHTVGWINVPTRTYFLYGNI